MTDQPSPLTPEDFWSEAHIDEVIAAHRADPGDCAQPFMHAVITRIDATRAKVEPLTALLDRLEYLRDRGYQPMYNGRPSCPFCSRFVDDEETHATGCVLLTLDAARAGVRDPHTAPITFDPDNPHAIHHGDFAECEDRCCVDRRAGVRDPEESPANLDYESEWYRKGWEAGAGGAPAR